MVGHRFVVPRMRVRFPLATPLVGSLQKNRLQESVFFDKLPIVFHRSESFSLPHPEIPALPEAPL
jgi:hypothetical protein